jgi:MarR-like DNA-binding transcriptional regulator SgrR of sgrS sRNA
MSISTSITGGSASNQLMDLLAVVANPDVYKAKLDALDAATAENKKYVEAIGPASEIVALREQEKSLRAEAESYKNETVAQANAGLAVAKTQAASIVSAAKAKVDAMLEAANVSKDKADAALGEVQAALLAAKKSQEKAEAAEAIANAQSKELAKTQAELDQALADAQALKASIIAKQEAFIKGL